MTGDTPPAPGTPDEQPEAPPEAPQGLDLQLAMKPRNDLGNARRLIARHGRNLIWVADPGTELGWHLWDPELGQWSREGGVSGSVLCAQRTAEAIRAEADAIEERGRASGEDPKEFEARVGSLRKFATSSGNVGKLYGMLKAAASRLIVRRRALDAHTDLLNVLNGTIELRRERPGDGEDADWVARREFRRDDLLTRTAPARHDPEAQCPRFLAFLETIIPDPATRVFLQRWFGYCLTGEVGEQVMVLFYGKGANGKSTLLNIVRGVIGPYTAEIPVQTLLEQKQSGGADATPDLARLTGARLVIAKEPERRARLSAAVIKNLTGGEPITVRPLYGEFFDFLPQFKLVLTFNARPAVAAEDDGMWRRILLVGFKRRIAKPVKDFHERLLAEERSGILNWMLDGYRLWREGGLAVPEAVRAATEQYRRDSDPIGQFVEACIEFPKEGEEITESVEKYWRVSSADLWARYKAFCEHNAMEPKSSTSLGKYMTERGIERVKASTVIYRGIALYENWRDPPAQ